MAEHPVARFRRTFQARLQSGEYEPIDVVQAVKGLSTSAHLVESLDIYCTLFDPRKPPASRNSFELCRTAGYNLFMRALELSGPQDELLELVRSFAVTPPPALKDAQLAKRQPVYRGRYESLSSKDRDEIDRRAKKLTDDRAAESASRRFLLDDLEKEFRNRKGHAPQPKELYAYDSFPSDARKEFEAHAIACQAAFYPKTHGRSGVWALGTFLPRSGQRQPEPSLAVATQRVETAFGAFRLFVEEQIKQPLDLFRLLAWAREPSEMNVSVEIRGRNAYIHSPTSAWSAVWRELYQDIAARGLSVALTRWHVAQMRAPRAYVGKDLQFVLGPLEPHWKELLKRRLAEHAQGPAPFREAQLGRRKVKVWGDLKGLELVDELESETQMKEMVTEMKADPKAVLSRRLDLRGGRAIYQESYQIFETAKDVFTVVWIPKQPRIDFAYVEVHAVPGFLFKAWGNFVGLNKLLEEQAFAILAANAAALAQFLLAYLAVVGLALDVITAGATGGIRVVILRFVEARIKDKLISEGLEFAKVKHPLVHVLAGMMGGLVPSAIKAPKVGEVKAPDDIDVPKPNMVTPSAGSVVSKAPAGPQVSSALPDRTDLSGAVHFKPKEVGAEARKADGAAAAADARADAVANLVAATRLRTSRPANENVAPDISLPQAVARNEEAMVRLGTGTHGRTMATADASAGGPVTYQPSATRAPTRADTRFAKQQETMTGKLSSTASGGAARATTGGARATPPRGKFDDKPISLWPRKDGLTARMRNFVTRAATIFREELDLQPANLEIWTRSTHAHKNTLDRLRAEFSDVTEHSQPFTGVTGPGSKKNPNVRIADATYVDVKSAARQWTPADLHVELKYKAYIEQNGKVLRVSGEKDPNVTSEQIQAYEVAQTALGVPAFVINARGEIFALVRGRWTKVGGPPMRQP